MGKQVLLLGVGETGCQAVSGVFTREFLLENRMCASSLLFDTDKNTLSRYSAMQTCAICDGDALASVVDRLGAENVREWFPCDWETDYTWFAKNMSMDCGANQWRMKAYLSFVDYISSPEKTELLLVYLQRMAEQAKSNGDVIDLYTVASLVGGTGSALYVPLTLFVKKRLIEMGVQVASSHAILVMPSVFEEIFSSDVQRTKGRANAYAAMRELHAINTAAYNGNGSDFRIGSDAGASELLFDCSKEEFQCREAAPFDRVVLVDRIPGVNGVRAHCSAIADLIRSLSLYDDKDITVKNDNVYEGMAQVKVVYSVENLKEYIVANQLCSYVTQQCDSIHPIAERKVSEQIWNAQANGLPEPNAIDAYSSEYLHACEAALAGQNGDVFGEVLQLRELSSPEIDALGCLTNVIESNFESLPKEKIGEMLRRLNESACKPASKKTDVKKHRLNVKNEADHGFEILNQLYEKCGAALAATNNANVENASLAIAGETLWSCLQNVIKDGETFLAPGLVMYRLCSLRKRLMTELKSLDATASSDDWVWEQNALPRSFFEVAPVSDRPRTRYARLGLCRLKRLLEEEPSQNLRIADDHKLLVEDLLSVFNRLVSSFKRRLFRRILVSADALIERYRTVLVGFAKNCEALQERIERALESATANSAHTVNVGTTQISKARFLAKYRETPEIELEEKLLLSRYVWDHMVCTPGVEFEASLGAMSVLLSNRFRSDSFYTMLTSMTALEVALEYSLSEPQLRHRNIFAGGRITSEINLGDSFLEKGIVERVSLILSKDSERYIVDECDLNCLGDPARIMEDFICQEGAYKASVALIDGAGPREFFVRREVLGLPLSSFAFFNERNTEHQGYHAYKNAMAVSVHQNTPMWNPALQYNRCGEYDLPLIAQDDK